MGYSRMEQETSIVWDEEEQIAHIYAASPVTMRKLDKLVAEFPDVYKCVWIDKLYDPDDSGAYYYTGRVEVGDPEGGLVKIFDVKVSANPWRLKASGETVETIAATPNKVFRLMNDWKPVVPTITTDALVSIQFGSVVYTMDGSGTFKFPKMLLQHGANVMSVVSGTANVTFTYQEGAI